MDHSSKSPLTTPLAAALGKDHPTWTDFCGWRMAVQFEGIVAEHLAVRHAAGLFDISHMGRLVIRGPGADEAVERLLTRRTADMTPGEIRYSFIADEAGRILDDLMVARREDGWQLVVNAANRDRVVAQIGAAGHADILDDRTFDTAMLAVQGPRAVNLLAAVWPESKALDRRRYRTWSAERDAAVMVGSRSGYTGEDGFEVFGPGEAVARLWLDLREAGAAACGLGARDSLRNEAALPLYGHELREETSPWELGLAYAVSPEKAFIGRDPLLERRDKPHGAAPQKRTGLVLTGRRIARENMPVFLGERRVGAVTSGTWSPLREQPIAQAYLDADVADSGATVHIDVRGRREQAAVVPLNELRPRSGT